MNKKQLFSLALCTASITTCNFVHAFGTNGASNRRDAISSAFKQGSATAAAILLGGSDVSAADGSPSTTAFSAFEVRPDASKSLNPSLQLVKPESLLKKLVIDVNKHQGGAIWLGEHHNSEADHLLQADIIRSIAAMRSGNNKNKPISIGLEQVQIQFQHFLDDYVAGNISEKTMLAGVEWQTRWAWSFDGYRPIFELAREQKIPLIALNVDAEDLAEVEQGGLPALNAKDRLFRYVIDPVGFAEFAKAEEFSEYVNYVIQPSYNLHLQMGLLRTTMSGKQLEEPMSFRNFFSGRILWDEAMASAASTWCANNPDGLMFGLVGADHVKFGKGINGRFERLAKGKYSSATLILNPTGTDSRPAGNMNTMIEESSREKLYAQRLTLQLRYLDEGISKKSVGATEKELRAPQTTGGVLAFSDYIVVNNAGDYIVG
eukprot:CAMPEP_0196813122 /NCGR_PEP_ID=MMETSP1362-20130617/33865_1 /TAXON_ID=163516 /ORGANISM="Leptocylindrus danicus, Strain CCMP1856" /LENGTH=431 /DNA_ID=CAMNT_0042189163 /DNA_START=75 /DNA_END=1370 /DNA_ORIENTATION=-